MTTQFHDIHDKGDNRFCRALDALLNRGLDTEAETLLGLHGSVTEIEYHRQNYSFGRPATLVVWFLTGGVEQRLDNVAFELRAAK